MLPEELPELINTYLNGTCTPEQKKQIENWYQDYQCTEKDFYGQDKDLMVSSFQRSLEGLHRKIELKQGPARSLRIKRTWSRSVAIAASLLLLVFAGLMVYKAIRKPTRNYYANDIAPGKNKAILTMANGTKVVLDDISNGTISTQYGVNVTKTKDGQLVYAIAPSSSKIPADGLVNTISTPRGGQYQVRLPDGTMVWLNAASSLQFPSTFSAAERIRKVTLMGEAYFEVAKNPKMPFVVCTDQQEVRVLGTHFNINAYKEEKSIKTSLLEGSVQVSFPGSQVILKPGQQADLAGSSVLIRQVDIENTVAWKNGKFKFVNENIRDLMRKIARWYDVEVIYEGTMANKDFSGSISRFENVSRVLDLLESTNTVHFKVEGRRITVMP